MHGKGAIGRGQPGDARKERGKRRAHAGRHHCIGDLFRARHIAGQGQHKGPHAPGTAIVAAHLIVDDVERLLPFARNPERQRIAALHFVVAAGFQRNAIIALRPLLLADQIIGEAAITREAFRIQTIADRLIEITQRLARPLLRYQDARHAGLYPAVHRIDVLRALQQRCRGVHITQPQRELSGLEQGGEIARVRAEPPHRAGQRIRIGRRAGYGLDLLAGVALGKRARRARQGSGDDERTSDRHGRQCVNQAR